MIRRKMENKSFVGMLKRKKSVIICLLVVGVLLALSFILTVNHNKSLNKKEGKIILVFGGAGYIGSHVVLELLRQGYENIVVFDNYERGYKSSLVKIERLTKKRITTFYGDINSKRDVNKVFRKYKVDIVFHLCAYAYVGESVKHPLMYYQNNIAGTLNILSAMEKNNVKFFVFSSSCTIFGIPKEIPITEDLPKKAISPYGATKLYVERILKECEHAWGLKFVSLRYFNAAGADRTGEIGEGHDPETHIIPIVIKTAMGLRDKVRVFGNDYDTPDKTCIRDYLHVSDISQAHIDSLKYLFSGKESLFANLGSEKGYSVMDVIKTTERVTGKKVNYEFVSRREGDPPKLVASSSRAKRVLGWKRKYNNLDDIIKTSYNFHKKFPNGYK